MQTVSKYLSGFAFSETLSLSLKLQWAVPTSETQLQTVFKLRLGFCPFDGVRKCRPDFRNCEAHKPIRDVHVAPQRCACRPQTTSRLIGVFSMSTVHRFVCLTVFRIKTQTHGLLFLMIIIKKTHESNTL